MGLLLIEDDITFANGIALLLKSEGFNVYSTSLGEKASISASSATTSSFSLTLTYLISPATMCCVSCATVRYKRQF